MSLAIRAARIGAQAGDAGYQRINAMDNEIYGGQSAGLQAVLNSRAMGDPGLPIFGGLLAGLGRTVVKGIGSIFRKKRPAIGGALIGSTAAGAFRPRDPFADRVFNTVVGPQEVPMVPKPGLGGAIQRFVPGGQTGMVAAGPPPKGYRLNKTGYFVERVKGQPEAGGEWVAPGTRYVKYRYNNPANARKTRRAISQVKRAKKYASELSDIRLVGKHSIKCK